MSNYKPYGTGIKEEDRYGDLLKKAQQKKEQEQKRVLQEVEKVIDWAEQSAKERDEDWLKKKQYRDGLVEKAKKRLDKGYKI